MKGSCSALSRLLEKYFDQEVTDEEKSLVEAHLHDCQVCQDLLKSMEKFRDLLRSPAEEALKKEDFQWAWRKIERGIRFEEKPTHWGSVASWLPIRLLLRKRVWLPAVAAAVILLAITVPLLFKKTPSSTGPSVVECVESSTYNVMIYEFEKAKITVIWLFEEPEKEIPSS